MTGNHTHLGLSLPYPIDEKKTIAITKRYLKQYPRLKTIHKKTSLTFIEEYETLKRAFYDYDTSYILLRYGCLEKAEKRLIDFEMIVSVDKFMNE